MNEQVAVSSTLSQLRQKLSALELQKPLPEKGFSLGVEPVDNALGGGLPRGALHEIFAVEVGDAGASAGFALGLALRAAKGRRIVWLRHALAGLESGDLYAPGLLAFGADPDALIVVTLKSETMVLRAALEVLRSAAPGALVMELWGKASLLDLTASRRLMMAASRSGVTGFVLRAAGKPQPSSALTRWYVGASPSVEAGAGAPGHPVFNIRLDRHRAGIAGRQWCVEWNHESKGFVIPATGHAASIERKQASGQGSGKPVSGSLVSLAFDRPAAADVSARPLRKAG